MKLQVLLRAVVAAALAGGPVAAQGYAPKRPANNWAPVASPTSPKPPASPYGPPPSPAFKPYQGSSTYSPRGGVNAYPAAPKPKASTTSLFGPDGKRTR